jgi:hypothetical protein
MATRAEWNRYWQERAGPDKPPTPVKVKKPKPQKNWSKDALKNAPYDWEVYAKSADGKPPRKSTRRSRIKAMSWPQMRNASGAPR